MEWKELIADLSDEKNRIEAELKLGCADSKLSMLQIELDMCDRNLRFAQQADFDGKTCPQRENTRAFYFPPDARQ